MSGGSMNYLYSKVLHQSDFPLDTPEREAFAQHLKLVAQALHDIEWVDSGDYGPGDENTAIRACLNPAPPQRKPLSADETMALANETAGANWGDEAHLQRFRAAIERAHGIT